MRSFVFTDESLRRQAGQFVWLAIDTEKAVNASFRTKYVVEAWPTFFIVDPATETPVLKWMGGATAPQLEKILDDGRSAYKEGRAGKTKGNELGQALARADKLFGAASNAEAVTAYRDVLSLAPAGWAPYGRATESLLFSLQRTDQNETCATTAKDAFLRLRKTPSAANVAASGLGCALALPPENAQRAPLVAHFVAACKEVLADRTTRIAADDRSSVYEELVQEREEAKDEAEKKKAAGAWAAFLEAEASRVKTPEGRAVFDSHRLSAYMQMGAPEKAVPMLQASEKALPEDYNPPARLAVAYKAMGKLDEALAASDRALKMAYGPRKLNVLRARTDIYVARGDTAAARRTIEEAIALAEAFPPGQRSEGAIASLKKRLATMP